MSESFKASRFKYVSDQPVPTSPFSIEVDKDKCIGCSVYVKECPVQSIEMVPRKEPSAKQQAACQYRCPAGTDIRGAMQILSRGGSYDDAWRMIVKTNPFPAVTGRVCPHPCEDSCNRCGVDTPLNIHGMERFIGDYAIEKDLSLEKPGNILDEKVGIVGSGPSGLSCSYQLAKLGYDVTVLEAAPKAGGMLRYAIPAYRLPEAVVDAEIGRIVNLGVTLKLGIVVGKDISYDELKKQFKAVYVAIGAQGSTAMGVEGEDGKVLSGLVFLKSVKEKNPVKLGKKVVVIGGGNTAIDAARTARRMGSDVTILYRRTLSEMPAHEEEVKAAKEEGVKIQFLCAPVKIGGSSNSVTVTCTKMELGSSDASGRPKPVPVKGSEFDVQCETVISAIGQDLNLTGLENIPRAANWINANILGQTAENGIFAGGDAVTGPGLVADAIGAGRKAALGIDAFIRGLKIELPKKMEISYKGIPLMGAPHFRDTEDFKRTDGDKLDASKRLASPDAEEALPFGQDQAVNESRRCLNCGSCKAEFAGFSEYFGPICIACHDCETICPNGAVVMPNFYRVDEGRWATGFDIPADSRDGIPNPLRLEKPLPFNEIINDITDVERVIYTRRSVRVFKPDPVPRELIERVLETGRFAPTAGNGIAYKTTVITDRKVMDELHKSTVFLLSNTSQIYMSRNPLRNILKRILVLVKPNSFDQRPMAAHSLGLGTCYVGFVTQTMNQAPWMKLKFSLNKRLGLEWPYNKPGMFILMGYPAVKVDGVVPREFPQVNWVE